MPERAGAVVVTGAGGYIAAAVAERFRQDGRILRLVSRPGSFTAESDNFLAREAMFADLRSDEGWTSVLADATVVIHLSARTDLRAAELDPSTDEKLNVDPVRSLLRMVAQRRGPKILVVFASAATVVGVRHSNPVDETTPDDPISIYDRHKLLCEELLLAADRSGTIDTCILRLANVYGYGVQSKNAGRGVLNSMMRGALAGGPLTLYGDGRYIRDFVYIDDVVNAFARAEIFRETTRGRRFLIASGQGSALLETFSLVAREAAAVLGRPVEIEHVPEPLDMHPIERRNFIGNPALFRRTTGWSPQFSLEVGIRTTLRKLIAERVLRE